MDVYLANRESYKLLRVYLLKNCYEVAKGLDKELLPTLSSSCLIVRKNKIKNETDFGYKEELKTGVLKKIHFVYISSLTDLITFLWVHYALEKSMTAGIFIDSIDQYFGERFTYEENGRSIMIVMKILGKLTDKNVGKKTKLRIGLSFSYNPYVFPRSDFMNFMGSCGATYWEVTVREITKNGQDYESEWTKRFLQLYGVTAVKESEE